MTDMKEINISNNIVLDDCDIIIEKLRLFSGISVVQVDDVVNFIKTEANTQYYIDEKMNIRTDNEHGIKYLWLDTGLENRKDGKPLFISLLSQEGYYCGHYVGDWKFLSSTIAQRYPSNIRTIRENLDRFKIKYDKRIDKRNNRHLTEQFKDFIEKENITENENRNDILNQYNKVKKKIQNNEYEEYNTKHDDITSSVASLLMLNNWKTKDGLDRYLKVIGCRLLQLLDMNKTQYYILNNIKSAVINTGLLNHFGTDIYILYRYNVSQKSYLSYKIMESKKDYIDNGFTKEQTSQEILPINFFDEGEDKFDATIEDFDVNHRSLLHIIEERRDRFPENVQSLSDNMIATKINNALELGLKMQKRDRNYAKPIYSAKTKSISWMMPLHINKEMTEEPELVLIVRKYEDFYEVKTIIPYDDEIKDRITALSLYNGLW